MWRQINRFRWSSGLAVLQLLELRLELADPSGHLLPLQHCDPPELHLQDRAGAQLGHAEEGAEALQGIVGSSASAASALTSGQRVIPARIAE